MKLPELRVSAAVATVAGTLVASAACCGELPWAVALALLAAAWLLFPRPGAWLAIFGASAVLVSFVLRSRLSGSGDPGIRATYGKMLLRMDDPRVSGLPELSGGMRTASAELLEFDEYFSGEPLKCGGIGVFVRFPRAAAPPVYGTLIECEGALIPVSSLRGSGGGFDFSLFLKRRGFRASAELADFRVVGRRRGVRGIFADGRDALLRRLFDGVRSESAHQLAAALFCGVGSGVPKDLRREFAAAGVVHIFSVSGMHVAVLALFLGALLRTLPFRMRWGLMAAAVWIYVFGTGAGIPAVRAGVMVTLWCLLRMTLFRISGFDILCWTASLLLVADPAIAVSTGAQYSFLITGALLLFSERGDRIRFPHLSIDRLVPDHFRSPGDRWRLRLVGHARMLVSGALIAFLAGAGVSLGAPAHRLIPGAVVANILVSLLMPGYFLLFFVQLVFGCCGAGRITAPLFEGAFALLRHIASFSTRMFRELEAVPPHWSLLALYSVALLTFLRARDRRVRMGAILAAGMAALWWICAPSGLPPALMVYSSGYGKPPLVAVADPASGTSVVVNVPDRESAEGAAEFLRLRGVRHVELVGFSDAGTSVCRGFAALLRDIPVRNVRLPKEASGKRAFLRRLGEGAGKTRFEDGRLHRDLFRTSPVDGGFRLDYFDPGSKLCFCMIVEDRDPGRMVYLKVPGRRIRDKRLLWSIGPEAWEYEFDNDR